MSDLQAVKVTQLGSIRQNQIFNRLNALHYQSTPMLVCLENKNHKHLLYLKANPHPAASEKLTATWAEDAVMPSNLSAYGLLKIVLASSRDTYEFEPVDYQLGSESFSCTIPDHAVETGFRNQQRFVCVERNIPVTLTQNAIVYKGRLLDYSASGILVDLVCDEDLTFNWLNSELSALLTIMPGGDPVYTGHVNLTARGNGQYLLAPSLEPTPRYTQKEYRARRQKFVPSPDLIFDHPITGKKCTLKIGDLGSLGFSATQERCRASLIPGLLIKKAKISFSSNFSVTCTTQVVSDREGEPNAESVKIGFAILHISLTDHLSLINLVQQAQDPRAYVSNEVDPEALFEFFFETGFIYPKKYAEIASRKEEVSQAYKTLYGKCVDVSRHFVYQNSGQIIGHFSSLRVYRKTWLSQHHAGVKGQHGGLRVVRAISEYINDSYQLNPTNLEYIVGYFQVSNRFPRKYFGDYVGALKDPKKTCLDCYSYVNEAKKFSDDSATLAPGWFLEKSTSSDMVEFYGYYQSISSGMLPEALDILPDGFDDRALSETYRANGLLRERNLYTLRHEKNPIALFDIQKTDFGLNLSEITNAITVYLIDPSPEHYPQVRFATYDLARENDKLADPVMVYPHTYLPECGFPVNKEYTMWTLNVPKGMESYMKWMNRYCR